MMTPGWLERTCRVRASKKIKRECAKTAGIIWAGAGDHRVKRRRRLHDRPANLAGVGKYWSF